MALPRGPVHPLPGCRCTVHAPEAQCWILKLAMSVAEVGAVHASSTLVWRLMSGRGTAIPDAGEVGDDHGHDRPGPRVNMSFQDTRSRLQFRVCTEEGPGDCCAVYTTNHMSIRHQMQQFTFQNASSILLILVRGPVLRHVHLSSTPSKPFLSVTIGRACRG